MTKEKASDWVNKLMLGLILDGIGFVINNQVQMASDLGSIQSDVETIKGNRYTSKDREIDGMYWADIERRLEKLEEHGITY